MKIYGLKMMQHKLIYVAFPLLLLLLVYRDVLQIALFFNTQAPDLKSFDGESVKLNLIFSGLKSDVLLFNLGFYTSFMLPVMIASLGRNYSQIKQKFLKLAIGKTPQYFVLHRRLKIQLALVPSLAYLLVFYLVITISILIRTFKPEGNLLLLSDKTWLRLLLFSDNSALVFFSLMVAVAIFTNSIFYFKLIDVFQHPIRSAIYYLLYIWVASLLLYHLVPYYLVPMTSIMTFSYGNWNIVRLACPYLLYVIGWIVLRKYEDEV